MSVNLRATSRHRWQRYWRLSPTDRHIARDSAFKLINAALLLQVFHLQTIIQFLLRLLPPPNPSPFAGTRQQHAQHLADIFVAVANLHPLPTTCLPRSLALWWLLGSEGFAAELVIGLQPPPGGREAHAWVELDGQALGDPHQIYTTYSIILIRYPKRQ